MKVRKGDRGPIVKEIQQRLLKLGFNIGPTHADGNFGQKTEEAVKKFQARYGLKATGVVDSKTYEKLIYETFELGDRTLYLHYPFFKGKDVLELQKILKGFGFNPGPLDGIFGPLTEKAVREFQMSVGLKPDGIVGPQTLKRLSDSARNFGSSSLAGYPERDIGTRPLSGYRIAIDAGHGGKDPGAVSPSGIKESEISRKIASLVEKILSGLGAEVYRVYEPDKKTDLKTRASKANSAKANLLISIHLNSSKNPEACGCEVLYSDLMAETGRKSKRLAEILVREISSSLGVKCRGAKVRNDLSLLRNSQIPAVIVEPLFLSNPEEEEMLSDDETLKRISSAIVRGIMKFFKLIKL